MKLPLRDFADVVNALKGPGENLSAAEKRQAARMTVTAKVNVHLVEANKVTRTFSVLTRDISLTGVGVLQSVALSSKQNVILELPRKKGPLFVVCEVMHCRPLADGVLAVGLEFAEMATPDMAAMLTGDNGREHARIRDSVLG